MLDNESLSKPDHYTWAGIDFKVEKPEPDFALLTPDVQNANDISPIKHLNHRAVTQIKSLQLPQFSLKRPLYTCVIVPSDRFLEATRIPANFGWATVCSRSVWPNQRENAVVTSTKHAVMGVENTTITDLTESQADILREAVHEYLPTLRDTYLPYPSASALPISEAMDEAVPRYVMGLQACMPNSTHFLTELKPDQLLTVSELWDGFSKHSSNPVSTNPAYGSAYLLGVSIESRLQQREGMTPTEALSEWLGLMIKATDSKDVVKKLADRLQVTEDILWNGRQLQIEGQEITAKDFQEQ